MAKSLFQRQQTSLNNTRDQVTGLLNQQLSQSDQNRRDSLVDRDAALNLLRSRIGVRSPSSQSTFDQLNADPTDTPFSRMLRSSIQSTIENPEVISRNQIDQFSARARETASTAVSDAIRNLTTSNAQRGVAGGVTQGTESDLMIQGAANVTGQVRDFEIAASQARADNLRAAQQLGVTFESERYRANNERLRNLAGFVTEEEARDYETIFGMAEILSNTVRQNPDLSGYASILVDLERASADLFSARENLALLQRQTDISEAQGNADINLRSRSLNIQSQLAEIQRRALNPGGEP